ncbi:hypothetical protein JMF89_04060 [Clostridiaceae bacterium UIB06]|uniref:Uncharacterized protein n=1 Tax=Clostridium thailandense TaxID=2794346 RepID=A0A949WTM4_9CLOT|nr:hypothetical protein [Clostridium thailandense]MBV7271642.1 hypothetical protein [Clostridium thailandense]MCH5136388.1 hypothetical protein [Clostridiaceae bacterium UIB06]
MGLPKPYFENIKGVGSLDIEYIIFESEYPVLFTCRDTYNNLYLCLCCDIRNEQRWIISKTNSQVVIDMLSDKITLYDSLRSPYDKNYVVTWSYVEQKETVLECQFSEMDELDLPVKDEYIEAEDGEFEEYIGDLELNEDRKFKIITTSSKKMQFHSMSKIKINDQYRKAVYIGNSWVYFNGNLNKNSRKYFVSKFKNSISQSIYINNQSIYDQNFIPSGISKSSCFIYNN